MADEEREDSTQCTFRLPTSQVEIIEALATRGVLGKNKSAVARHLIGNAIKELIENDFVKKYLETVQLLKK